MNSDAPARGTSPLFRFAVMFAITVVAGIAGRELGDAVRSDLHHDVVWYRYSAPITLRSRADRWYPWTAPILFRWRASDDPARFDYAETTIKRLGGWPARFPAPAPSPASSGAASGPQFTSLRELLKNSGTNAKSVALYSARDPIDRRYLVLSEADETTRDPRINAFLASLAGDPHTAPADALTAAAVLRANGDVRFDGALRKMLNGENLSTLGAVDNLYVLLKLAAAFPDTRWVRAMKAYDAVRGGTYLGDDRDPVTLPKDPARRIARARADEARWQAWLRANPTHPGADDATYWYARSLELQGRRVDALAALTTALGNPPGDGDMLSQLWSRFLYLLDVGTTDDELDAWILAHRDDVMAPFVAYGRAVRYARVHQYYKAMSTANSVNFEGALRALIARKPPGTFGPYDADIVIGDFRKQMALWRRQGDLIIYTVDKMHPELREVDIAARMVPDGWLIPYLVLFGEARGGGDGPALPGGLDSGVLADNYRKASALAVNLSLTQENLLEQYATPWTREHDRYRVVALLYEQAAQYPDSESSEMHPLPGFPPEDPTLYTPPPDRDLPAPGNPFYAEYKRVREVQAWYARQAIFATRELIREFPKSSLADSALLCVYEMTGETKYLEEMLQRYPDGDRAEEARAALYAATHRT